ncbi:MAG: LUD domain-containing protein, partial [Pseudomonadota bacterium]
MKITTPEFKKNAVEALQDEQLQKAMRHVRGNFIKKRADAAAAIDNFEAMRDRARDIKNHTLDNLDIYLEKFEERVQAQGGHVHWAATAKDAREIFLKICQEKGAKSVTKGKSMITEEIELNDFMIENDIEPVETDLGEYIIQLRGEHPSHIIAPAVHLNMDQVRDEFREHHTHLPEDRPMEDPQSLLTEARGILRQKFINADIGVTGANFLVAETGTSVIVTNEGNGDLTQILPKVHVVFASLEKVVPTLEDMSQILRVLARSATGQEMSVYTTLSSGPK